MARDLSESRLQLYSGDITVLAVGAIANAADERMLGGGGVDGAIHRAAGPRLLEACRALPEVAPGVRCPTGEARLTPGFDLSADHVIHTVGPVWRGGQSGEPELLASCYRCSLQLATGVGIRSVAFSAISCGVFGYPIERACRTAVGAVRQALDEDAALERVVLVAFGEEVRRGLEAALAGT